jgi:hypothetical protein
MARIKAEETEKAQETPPKPKAAKQPAMPHPELGISGQPKADTAAVQEFDESKLPLSARMRNGAEGVLQAPGVIAEGLRRNAAGVLVNASLNTAVPNAYTAAKEGRNPLPGLGLDALQFLVSPLRALRLAAKAQPVFKSVSNSRFVKPINKTPFISQNAKRNILPEALIGAGDNAIWELASNKLNDREFNPYSLGISSAIGGITGAGAGALQAREQAKKMNDYAKWLNSSTHKQQVKQNIRNAQNDTDSNMETFSKMVNEESPLLTTHALRKKKEEATKEASEKIGRYASSPEANAPASNATLADFQKTLEERLYRDASGNLSQSEKDLVMKNFYDDSLDMLLNSPTLKKYMEENSSKVLGNPRAYLGNKEFIDLAMKLYSLTPNDMNLLRRSLGDKTTLTIPTKPGYVRAGQDNRGNNEYSQMFKKEIETRPETKQMNALNKDFSKAKNQEEIVQEVLMRQGHGGIMERHFPFFDLNPEINPTIAGSSGKSLRVRSVANKVGAGVREYLEIPEENKEDYSKMLASLVEDAKKLGIATDDGIKKYIVSRLEGGNVPEHEVVMQSGQKRGER